MKGQTLNHVAFLLVFSGIALWAGSKVLAAA
jgi:hypothetical protein